MVDTIAVIDDDLIERMSMNNADRAYLLLEEGRKTEAAVISTHAGGGAVNAAVCFARLGFDVSVIVKLGADDRAAFVQGTLTKEGVRTDRLAHTDQAGSGASVLISAHDRNAAIFTFRGSNSLLKADDLSDEAFAANIVYVSTLSEASALLFPDIVKKASGNGTFVAVNPGIRQLADRGEDFESALEGISLLSMNRDEAAALLPRLLASSLKPSRTVSPSQKADYADLMRRGFVVSGFTMSLARFFETLLASGPRCVLVTDGKKGAYAADAEGISFCPSLETKVIGTAGAGDAFTSTFTAFYASGSGRDDALKNATVNAASVIGFADTQSGLLTGQNLAREQSKQESNLRIVSWRYDALL